MTDFHDLITRIERAKLELDRDTLHSMLLEMHQPSAGTDRPFDAAIELKPEYRQAAADGELESALAMNWANHIARAERWVAYQLKVAFGFDGRIVVEEGDSWFQYPVLLTDTVDHLDARSDLAIRSLSGAGHMVRDMAASGEYNAALRKSGARVMMLSGGGNDLLGDGRFAGYLRTWAEGMAPADVLDQGKLRMSVDAILRSYEQILADVAATAPGVRVLGHGYDLPYPQAGGDWLGKPLTSKGIPLDAGREVVRIVMDSFADRLKALEATTPHFRFLDMRGVVDLGKNSWFDELHPHDAGFGRVAEVFRGAVEKAPAATGAASHHILGFESAMAGMSDAASGAGIDAGGGFLESGPGTVVVLDPGHGGETPPVKVGGSSWNNATGPQGTLEKNLTLDVAKRTRDILVSRGRTVVLTRESNVNLGLTARAGVARVRQADAFVSIHFNASDSHTAQGTETFVHPSHTAASAALCRTVQAATVAALGYRDRNDGHPGGVKTGSFGVINKASHSSRTAAVLHEVSFMDRIDEEARLLTDAHKNTIAKALANGIDAFLASGTESAMSADSSGDLGDAIEGRAAQMGLSVGAYLGGAEGHRLADSAAQGAASVGAAQGGDALIGAESSLAPAPRGGGFAQWLRVSTLRSPAAVHLGATSGGQDTDAQNDVNEFRDVDIGQGLDVAALVHGPSAGGFESAMAPLAQYESAASGFDLVAFEAHIGALNLRHFVAAEFLAMGGSNAPGGSCAGHNSFPPAPLWHRISATAQMLDEIRERLGAPVRISSCYRAPPYNACIGGASQSLHMEFNAVDWSCSTGTPTQWASVARAVRDLTPTFRGGVGLYNTFVHIDTRGTNANFTGAP